MTHIQGYCFDPDAAIAALRAADPVLGRLIDRVGPFRLQIERSPSVFEALLQAIVYQQLHGKAAAAILARLKGRFGANRCPEPREILRAESSQLRSAGLSRQKIAALRDLAAKACDGTVPSMEALQRLSDEEIVERLTAVRGIGVWTVQMLLIFRLGRPDVLPVHDFGIRHGYAIAFRCKEAPKPKQIAKRGERWRPFRTVASWYLWRGLDARKQRAAHRKK